MAFNGSGVFSRLYSWTNDALAGIKIRADRMDNEMNGMATGLSTCITKDGQTTITANLPMAGFRHTNVDDAVDVDDYASFGQVRNNPYYYADTGAVNTYVITPNPSFGSYTTGLSFDVKIANTNTGASTLNVNGLGAKAINKAGNALLAGELVAGKIVTVKYNGTDFDLIGGEAGGVMGAASSTDNAIVRFDGTTGKLIQNSTVTVSDGGNITANSITGRINTGASSGYTIASGVATIPDGTSFVTLDTEGGAATDDLDTITQTGATTGDILIIRTSNSARDITVKNGTGNIFLNGSADMTLISSADRLVLVFRSGSYVELCRSQATITTVGQSLNVGAATGTTSTGDVNIAGNYKVNGTAIPVIRSYTSSDQVLTLAAQLVLPHSLAATPRLVQLELVCQTAEGNYSVNDVVVTNPSGNDTGGTGSSGFSVVTDATNITIRVGSTSIGRLLDKTTGVNFTTTAANWRLRVKAYTW